MGFFIPIVNVQCDLCNGEEKCIKWCPSHTLESYDLKEAALLRKSIKVGNIPILRGWNKETGLPTRVPTESSEQSPQSLKSR